MLGEIFVGAIAIVGLLVMIGLGAWAFLSTLNR